MIDVYWAEVLLSSLLILIALNSLQCFDSIYSQQDQILEYILIERTSDAARLYSESIQYPKKIFYEDGHTLDCIIEDTDHNTKIKNDTTYQKTRPVLVYNKLSFIICKKTRD